MDANVDFCDLFNASAKDDDNGVDELIPGTLMAFKGEETNCKSKLPLADRSI